MPMETGSQRQSTARSGFHAMFPQIGSLITMDTVSIAIRGDGCGSRMNLGVMRPFTMAAG